MLFGTQIKLYRLLYHNWGDAYTNYELLVSEVSGLSYVPDVGQRVRTDLHGFVVIFRSISTPILPHFSSFRPKKYTSSGKVPHNSYILLHSLLMTTFNISFLTYSPYSSTTNHQPTRHSLAYSSNIVCWDINLLLSPIRTVQRRNGWNRSRILNRLGLSIMPFRN